LSGYTTPFRQKCSTCDKPFLVGQPVVRVYGSGRYTVDNRWHGPMTGPCVPKDLNNTVMVLPWTVSDLMEQTSLVKP
jgi:hypothetical protein